MSTLQTPVHLRNVQNAPNGYYAIAVDGHLGSNIMFMMSILQFCIYLDFFEDIAALAAEHLGDKWRLLQTYQMLNKECRFSVDHLKGSRVN